MKVLIVGCGAVGQVFGLFLQKAGVELGLFDHPATTERLKQALDHGGKPLYQIDQSRGKEPLACRLEHYQVLMDEAECQRFQPNLIWFTTPSPVYHSDWFRKFLQKVPSERVVCFAPEGGRSEFFPEGVEKDRLVFGGVTFMAWQGDLEGGGGKPEAVNFWRPAMLGIPLAGTKKAGRDVVQLLRKAGFRASLGKPDSRMQASVTAVMTAFVAGLELAGWSLGAFRKSQWLSGAAGAALEAVRGQISKPGLFQRVGLVFLLSQATFRLATLILPKLVPFDLEKYLKFHYLKTREQSLKLLYVFAEDGKRRGLPVENIRNLRQELVNSA
jgi:Ketopantoate reductase PanE/ApbA